MCQPHRAALAAIAWLGVLLAAPVVAAPPRAAAPLIGDFAYDRSLHDALADDPDPLPIETSEDFEWMIHDSRPHLAPARAGGLEERVGQSAPFRLAHRLGADEVIVPVWTLHL